MAVQMIKVFEPSFYEKFACTASGCSYSCCRGWSVTYMRRDYNKLRSARLSPDLKKAVEHVLQREKKPTASDVLYANIRLDEDGFCPLLSPEGLCKLQLEGGPSLLSNTCKSFPRLQTVVGDYLQRGLTAGCEAVVALLAEERNGLRFVEYEIPRTILVDNTSAAVEGPRADAEPFFPQTQALCIAILQDRRYTLPERIILLGLALKDFDEAVTSATVPDWLQRRMALVVSEDAESIRKMLSELPIKNSSLSALNTLQLALSTRIIQHGTVWEKLVETLSSVLIDSETTSNVIELPDKGITLTKNTYTFSPKLYAEVLRVSAETRKSYEYLLENVMVNFFFSKCFPLRSAETAWDAYLAFCSAYCFYAVACSCYVAAHPENGSYEHAIMLCSRALAHSDSFLKAIACRLHDNDTDTLAHMALLVNG